MELRYYQTASGGRPFVEWLANLTDRHARWRIESRLAVVARGSLGDAKPVGEGLLELRIDWGPGYRVYFARLGAITLLVLCGGDKRSQGEDIRRAKDYFQDYKRRTSKATRRRT